MYDPKPVMHGTIPISAGVPPLVRWAFIIGFIAIICVVSVVLGASRYNHVWPSANSGHIKLDPS
jgi:hypothetical protein